MHAHTACYNRLHFFEMRHLASHYCLEALFRGEVAAVSNLHERTAAASMAGQSKVMGTASSWISTGAALNTQEEQKETSCCMRHCRK